MRRFLALVLVLAVAGCFGGGTTPSPTPSLSPPAALPWHNFLPGTGQWSQPTSTPVNFVVTNGTGPANELTIAVNPKDPLNLVAGGKDYALFAKGQTCPASGDGPEYPRNVWSGQYWSTDGGATWRNQLMPGHPLDATNATHPNRAWPCNSDPVVVFDQDGTAYYSGLGIRGPITPDPAHPCVNRNRSIWLMTSQDKGATWGDFSCVVGTTTTNSVGFAVDKQWFAVDGDYVYFTYMSFNPSDIDLMFRRSTDGGRTWEPEGPLWEYAARSHDLSGRQFGMPALGPNGQVYVIWRNFGGDDGIYFTSSSDHGGTFTVPGKIADIDGISEETLQTPYRLSSIPVLVADAGTGSHKGNLYVVWSDYTGRDANIVFIRSTDGGQGWTAPKAIPEGGFAGGHQFLPWAAVSPNGDLHVAWLSTNASGQANRLNAFLRTSLDGGNTWLPTLKLNEGTIMAETCFHQNEDPFIGDYLGLTATDVAVHPLWPDGALGRCNAVTATVLR